MLARLCILLRRQRTNQRQVPVAQRGKSSERLFGTVRRVSLRPQVLIEGLNRVVVECKRLTIAETECQLTIRQMDNDLPGAPLAESNRLVDTRFAKRFRKFCEPRGRSGKHAHRILIGYIRSVWSFRVGHDNKVAREKVRIKKAECGSKSADCRFRNADRTREQKSVIENLK